MAWICDDLVRAVQSGGLCLEPRVGVCSRLPFPLRLFAGTEYRKLATLLFHERNQSPHSEISVCSAENFDFGRRRPSAVALRSKQRRPPSLSPPPLTQCDGRDSDARFAAAGTRNCPPAARSSWRLIPPELLYLETFSSPYHMRSQSFTSISSKVINSKMWDLRHLRITTPTFDGLSWLIPFWTSINIPHE